MSQRVILSTDLLVYLNFQSYSTVCYPQNYTVVAPCEAQNHPRNEDDVVKPAEDPIAQAGLNQILKSRHSQNRKNGILVPEIRPRNWFGILQMKNNL